MNERASSLWIVALVAFAGLFRFLPASTSSEQTTPSPSELRGTGSPPATIPADSLALKLLADYYLIGGCPGNPVTTSGSTGAVPAKFSTIAESLPCRQVVQHFKKDHGKVLLALVPDPVDASQEKANLMPQKTKPIHTFSPIIARAPEFRDRNELGALVRRNALPEFFEPI